jgi:hypothetical protein
VQWLGLAGIGCLIRAYGWRGAAAAAVATVYALTIASVGLTLGVQFPGRLLVVLTPLVVVPLALVLERVPAARIPFLPLLALSGLIALGSVHNSRELFPDRVDPNNARVFPVRHLEFAFPKLYKDPDVSFVLEPGRDFPPRTGSIRGGRAVASGADGPGFLLFGPYAPLLPGRYRAAFRVTARGTGAVGRVEVTAPPDRVLARRAIRPPGGRIVLLFSTPGGLAIETRVYFAGRGSLATGPVRVTAAAGTVARSKPPDEPSALWWLAATVAAAGVLAAACGRARPRKRSALTK